MGISTFVRAAEFFDMIPLKAGEILSICLFIRAMGLT
jgi:hypothetical protein